MKTIGRARIEWFEWIAALLLVFGIKQAGHPRQPTPTSIQADRFGSVAVATAAAVSVLLSQPHIEPKLNRLGRTDNEHSIVVRCDCCRTSSSEASAIWLVKCIKDYR